MTVAEMMDAILLDAARKVAKRKGSSLRSNGRLRSLAAALEMSSGGQVDILERLHALPGGTHG